MYTANEKRYDTMKYNRCGNSGLKLPVVSLGFWHNFGDFSSYENMKYIRPSSCEYSHADVFGSLGYKNTTLSFF